MSNESNPIALETRQAGRRRHYTAEQKRALLDEAARPGQSMSIVARQYGVGADAQRLRGLLKSISRRFITVTWALGAEDFLGLLEREQLLQDPSGVAGIAEVL